MVVLSSGGKEVPCFLAAWPLSLVAEGKNPAHHLISFLGANMVVGGTGALGPRACGFAVKIFSFLEP